MNDIELTRKLIGLDTRNPPGNEGGAAHIADKLLSGAGFSVNYHEFAPRRRSVIAQIGNIRSGRALCLTGHLDTVPLGSSPWTHDPFAGVVCEGRLYGRGAADMKAGVASLVTAAINLASALRDTVGITVVLTASEEGGCHGSEDLIRREGLLVRPGAMIIAEPTSNSPYVGHRGAMKFTATFRGRAAHGSMPGIGVNAIYAAARATVELQEFGFGIDEHPMMGSPTLNVGTFHGGDAINSIPDEATIGVDVRSVLGMSHADLLSKIRNLLGQDTLIQVIQDMPAVWTDPKSEWIVRAMRVWSALSGKSVQPKTLPYNTDAGNFRKLWPSVPMLILGPGEPEMAHQTDEYCYINQISEATKIYEALIAEWCDIAL